MKKCLILGLFFIVFFNWTFLCFAASATEELQISQSSLESIPSFEDTQAMEAYLKTHNDPALRKQWNEFKKTQRGGGETEKPGEVGEIAEPVVTQQSVATPVISETPNEPTRIFNLVEHPQILELKNIPPEELFWGKGITGIDVLVGGQEEPAEKIK